MASVNPLWLRIAAPAALIVVGLAVLGDPRVLLGAKPTWDGVHIPECDSDPFKTFVMATLKDIERRTNATTLKIYPFHDKAYDSAQKFRECEGVVMLSNGWTPNYVARLFVEDGQLYLKLTPTTLNAK